MLILKIYHILSINFIILWGLKGSDVLVSKHDTKLTWFVPHMTGVPPIGPVMLKVSEIMIQNTILQRTFK